MAYEYTRGNVLTIIKRGPISFTSLCASIYPMPRDEADMAELRSTLDQLDVDGKVEFVDELWRFKP